MNGPHEFWAAVDQSGGPDACWPWKRALLGKPERRYGQLRWRGKNRKAHRIAFLLAKGFLPNLPLDHTCHDPNTCAGLCLHTRCCNPRHLEPVTQRVNNARRARLRCLRGHPKTPEFGIPRGTKWRCCTCEIITQRERRARRKAS